MNETNDAFEGIVGNLINAEANDYLDLKLKILDRWIRQRERHGTPTELRDLIDFILPGTHDRNATLVLLSAALWRLRETRSQ